LSVSTAPVEQHDRVKLRDRVMRRLFCPFGPITYYVSTRPVLTWRTSYLVAPILRQNRADRRRDGAENQAAVHLPSIPDFRGPGADPCVCCCHSRPGPAVGPRVRETEDAAAAGVFGAAPGCVFASPMAACGHWEGRGAWARVRVWCRQGRSDGGHRRWWQHVCEGRRPVSGEQRQHLLGNVCV
jgi:hypothetical protein